MSHKFIFTRLLSLLIATGVSTSSFSAAPPNPTASDARRNTAGGTGALVHITDIADDNTGFGMNVLNSNGGSGNTAVGSHALRSNAAGGGNTAIGTRALNTNTEGNKNTAIGIMALSNNTDGNNNTATGSNTLKSNTTGSDNTSTGSWALFDNTEGNKNTAIGANALKNNTLGNNNAATGFRALFSNITGNSNTACGTEALLYNNNGINNTASGFQSLYHNITGVNNTAVGLGSLFNNNGDGNTAVGLQALINQTVGSSNLALGLNAGIMLKTGSFNIYLSNSGVATESKTIRIGSNQTRTFIAGIHGIKTGTANAVPVVIDSNGQLGTINSSERFKKDIQDMAKASQALYKLRPVTYRYKEADDNGENPIEYGLIAEEVAKVYPDLVAYGADGKIETVQYHKLTPMLLNELQFLNKSLQAANQQGDNLASMLKAEQQKNRQLAQEVAGLKAQAGKVTALEKQVAELQTQVKTIQTLTARLSRIEAGQMVGLNR